MAEKGEEKKSRRKKKNNEEEIVFCDFCKKPAEFRCGNCHDANYCTIQHQKADWPSHKRRCIKPEDKLRESKKIVLHHKKKFFEKLANEQQPECQPLVKELTDLTSQIKQLSPTEENEIEYGSSVCAYVKFLLGIKNFNEAQEILNTYMKDSNDFLTDTSKIQRKIDLEDEKRCEKINLIEGKLQLISTLCNLTHQIVRNSVSVIEILLKHIQKFYGPESLEVSNIYFQLGSYFNFLNQPKKAIACFLVSSKIRKQKATSCLFNIALIFMKQDNYHKAIHFFFQTIDMIDKHGDKYRILENVYLGLGECFKRLNHFDHTVEYFEKALCHIQNNKNYMGPEDNEKNLREKVVKEILKQLREIYKKQFEVDDTVNLPKEIPYEIKPSIVLTNANLQQFWEIETNASDKKKKQEWIKSFKNQVDKTKYKSNIPMTNPIVEKNLFNNYFLGDSNGDPSSKEAINQVIKLDLEYMSTLTSIQVRYMHELNRLLSEIKDKETMFEVIENSNLMQTLSEEKKQRFYQINPKLKKSEDKTIFKLLEGFMNSEEKKAPPNDKIKPKPGDQNLKLNLEGINRNV